VSVVRIVHEGETVDADELTFTIDKEIMGVYNLSDGARIDLDHKVKAVYKLRDKKKEDGSPVYIVTGNVSLTTTQPATKSGEVE